MYLIAVPAAGHKQAMDMEQGIADYTLPLLLLSLSLLVVSVASLIKALWLVLSFVSARRRNGVDRG